MLLSFSKIFFYLFITLHPFFVSVFDINHNIKNNNVEISIKVFTDDLETILKKNNKQKIDLSSSLSNAEVNKLISNYVQSKLLISIDNKVRKIAFVGYEIQKESVWIYLEINEISSFKKINISCNFLYDFEEKQMNIFNVKSNGVEKNYKLDNPKSSLEFVF